MTYHRKTKEVARNNWRGILQKVGLAENFLSKRHGPCPFCGGTDRWRWVDDNGDGGGICGQCGGVPDGIAMVMKLRGLEWREASAEVDTIMGNHQFVAEAPKPVLTQEDRAEKLRSVWKASQPTVEGDIVHRYLEARGVDQREYWGLRTAERLWSPDGAFPAMVGVISDRDGKPVSLHRTFLDGKGGKAAIAKPRMMMPGELPDGACIRLAPIGDEQEAIGVAEGIETALAASAVFAMPVWAVLNTSMMANWLPPEGVRSVTIFGDNDTNHAGHKAAYTLSNKIRTHKQFAGIATDVQIPPVSGTDWADELLRQRRKSA